MQQMLLSGCLREELKQRLWGRGLSQEGPMDSFTVTARITELSCMWFLFFILQPSPNLFYLHYSVPTDRASLANHLSGSTKKKKKKKRGGMLSSNHRSNNCAELNMNSLTSRSQTDDFPNFQTQISH